jgi:hypothetical protein
MPAYDPNNIFAKILRGELPCYKVYEDDKALAFLDIMPRAPGHALVLPKAPARNILDVTPDDFFHAGGDPLVFLEPRHAIAPRHATDTRLSPWNRALARSNQLLDQRYGVGTRRTVLHVPLAVDVNSWQDMVDVWPEPFRQTTASRFRATDNIAPEHLYPHYLLEEGWGRLVTRRRSRRAASYHPLNNIWIFQRLGLARVRWRRSKFVCLNDDFGAHPNARVVALVRRVLDAWFPQPSRFERRDG